VALTGFLLGEIAPRSAEPDAPALAELDRLEATLTTMSFHAEARTKFAARLRDLLVRLKPEDELTDDVSGRIESASDDEIFDFIDNELGSA
jgi:hypothetical protein